MGKTQVRRPQSARTIDVTSAGMARNPPPSPSGCPAESRARPKAENSACPASASRKSLCLWALGSRECRALRCPGRRPPSPSSELFEIPRKGSRGPGVFAAARDVNPYCLRSPGCWRDRSAFPAQRLPPTDRLLLGWGRISCGGTFERSLGWYWRKRRRLMREEETQAHVIPPVWAMAARLSCVSL